MRIFILAFFMFFCCAIFSQQQHGKQFNVIISLSSSETDIKVEKIKALINTDTTALSYEGYCKSQKCIILKASFLKYNNADNVISYLKSIIGDAILASKDYSIKEYYKLCTFASEQEYQHFKTTYK